MYLWRFNTSFYYFPVDLFTPRNNKRMWKNKLWEISLSLFSVNVTYILPHWREIHYFLSSIIFIRNDFICGWSSERNRITALFNNMRTLKLKGRPINSFFAAVDKTYGGSSQLTTTAKHCFVVWTLFNDLMFALPAIVGGSGEEPTNRLIDGCEKRICRLSFEF